ncbi:MAG: DUF6261 family protein [Dysgonamonadaceae bacterium]|jgi:hypothetical protein|nr:DUF6261 family protein [Dysgonamonadaceae bacterium]
MVQLKTILFSYLPNEAHYNYDSKVKKEIGSSSQVVRDALGELVTDYNTWYAQEEALMLWVKKSVLTEKIAEANRKMDRVLTAIRTQVRSLEYSSSINIAPIATRVYVMLNGYGNVNRKPYEDQQGDVRAILLQISSGGPYYNDIVSLSQPAPVILTLLTELNSAFNDFDSLLAQRGEASNRKPDKTFKQVRKGIEAVYRNIARIINAGAVMNTAPGFETFINHLNPEIELLNREHHHVRHDISLAEPEQIQPQTYTGRPITFVPKVLYVTIQGTIQLELGKDFDVTFDNNVEVGNATCTIHGKGSYKGKKTVTFIIKRV